MDGQTFVILALAVVGTLVISAAAAVVRRRRGRGGVPPDTGTAGAGGGGAADLGANAASPPIRGRATSATRQAAGGEDPVLDIVRWFRPRGFFVGETVSDEQLAAALAERIEREWGTSLDELAADQQAADMHVLSLDARRVFRPGSKYIHRGDGTYAEVLQRSAALAPAAFAARDVTERWDSDEGPIHVTYRLHGVEHRFTTAADRYLDASIVLHLDLAADDPDVRLRVCDHLGMPDFVIALDDATSDALRRDRGWTFWDDVATAG